MVVWIVSFALGPERVEFARLTNGTSVETHSSKSSNICTSLATSFFASSSGICPGSILPPITISSSQSSSRGCRFGPRIGTGGCPLTRTLAMLGPAPAGDPAPLPLAPAAPLGLVPLPEPEDRRRARFRSISNGGNGGRTSPPGVEGGSTRSAWADEGAAPAGAKREKRVGV